MPEAVRLVIWDLDETFWKGTLSEGGVTEYIQANHDAVVELAKRGIVSSICSKNDHNAVKEILTERGLWDYFVFPSIDWSSKGPRIASLIESVQLRAPTVLFLDDNPQNLEEAKFFTPAIQTGRDLAISDLLSDPRFKGKDDPGLNRLQHYKLLENRKADESASGPDNVAFLRGCGITVRFEYDLEAHIDRVVELINRTNQLNFTKRRVAEDADAARAEVRQLIRSYAVQGALLEVSDRYGHHGFCGLYIHNSEGRRLDHFCFSCRILGMGVEQWLYNRLNRPSLRVVGEVISDVFDRSKSYDWITVVTTASSVREAPTPSALNGIRVTAHGPCEIGALVHYFGASSGDAVGEYNIHRNGSTFRIDHSIFLRYAAEGIGDDMLEVATQLGFIEQDFQTRLFAPFDRHIVLLGFACDTIYALYRHRRTGLVVPFYMPGGGNGAGDIRYADPGLIPNAPNTAWISAAHERLCSEFDYLGLIREVDFKNNIRIIDRRIPSTADVFIIEMNEIYVDAEQGVTKSLANNSRLNRWVREAFSARPGVNFIAPAAFATSAAERLDALHFDRRVYFRMYQAIERAMQETLAE